MPPAARRSPLRRRACVPGRSRLSRRPWLGSLRLAAQDVALSRRKQGFESPRERQLFQWFSNNFSLTVGGISKFSPMGGVSKRIILSNQYSGRVSIHLPRCVQYCPTYIARF